MKIEISDKLFRRLQKLSAPLLDTPESVISNLIDFYEDTDNEQPEIEPEKPNLRITQDDLIPLIIVVLELNGGRLSKNDVESHVHNMIKNLITDKWYTEKVSHNIERWKHNLAWAKERAKRRGFIKKPKESNHGCWELTDTAPNLHLDYEDIAPITKVESIKKLRKTLDKKTSKNLAKIKISGQPSLTNNPEYRDAIEQTTEKLMDSGDEYFINSEFESALECYTAAIILDPLNINAYLARAEAYEEVSDISKVRR